MRSAAWTYTAIMKRTSLPGGAVLGGTGAPRSPKTSAGGWYSVHVTETELSLIKTALEQTERVSPLRDGSPGRGRPGQGRQAAGNHAPSAGDRPLARTVQTWCG